MTAASYRVCRDCPRRIPLDARRCAECSARHERERAADPIRRELHTWGWRKKSKAARAARPWCSVRGCMNRDLTLDHVVSRKRGGTAEGPTRVLCRAHNAAKGTGDGEELEYR